jgi:N-methylhydantoinase A
LPGIDITLSSDVCPEAREYERFSTACANAYVQPVIGAYLERLQTALEKNGFACPLLLMSSGGGLMTVETAIAFPIRLVESGPAGGAILATHIASLADFSKILAFDMGGTTAKVCLIDDGRPQLSRDFEVDRQYRFLRGSGLPLRIPVIDMVEIGAGGGSIASVDSLGRITVGPRSAGSEPGPACYGRWDGSIRTPSQAGRLRWIWKTPKPRSTVMSLGLWRPVRWLPPMEFQRSLKRTWRMRRGCMRSTVVWTCPTVP